MPSAGPLRTRVPARGSLAGVTPLAGQGPAAGLSPGLCQPMRHWDRSPVILSSLSPAPWKERAGPFLSSALARGRIRAGQWWDKPVFLHLIFCLLFWMPRFESVPNEAKINFLRRCHKYSTYWEGSECAAFYSCLRKPCGVLYLAFYFPCAAVALSLDKAALLVPLSATQIPACQIPRIWELAR